MSSSTPSYKGRTPTTRATHLIINQGGSSDDEVERRGFADRRPTPSALHDVRSDEEGSTSSGQDLQIPVFQFGATVSETQAETQSMVVNAFHKVLSVLRQYVFF